VRGALLGLGVGCGDGGGGSSSVPETPVAWRGATITGERPQSGQDEVEAGWQRALSVLGGTGPEPAGWTIQLFAGPVPCPPHASAGCVNGQAGGLTDPRARTISASWLGSSVGVGDAFGTTVTETLAHEFATTSTSGVPGTRSGPGV
jgi:hypothetical protein